MPAEVPGDCRVRADIAFENDKPMFWIAGVVIVGFWVVTACLVYRLVAGTP